MKKVFVVDTDKQFHEQVRALCPENKVDVRTFSSSTEIFPLLGDEKPGLIFLDISTDDLNDFVMHDLLKKTGMTLFIPLLIVYTEETESALAPYEKLKYKAEGYHKKPIPDDQVKDIISNYLKYDEVEIEPALPTIEESDEDDFSVDALDRLVRGEAIEMDLDGNIKADERESTNPFDNELADTKSALSLDDETGLDANLDEALGIDLGFDDKFAVPEEETEPENVESPEGRGNRELEVQVVSLERQNEFLRSENKDLTKKVDESQNEAVQLKTGTGQLKAQLEKANAELEALKETAKKTESRLQQEQGRTGEITEELSKQETRIAGEMESLKAELVAVREVKTQLTSQLQLKDQETVQQITRLEEAEAETKRVVSLVEQLELRVQEKEAAIADRQKEVEARNQQVNLLEQEKKELKNQVAELGNQSAGLAKQVEELGNQVADLSNQLTDKEREQVAKNHEFEKDLQKKTDQLLQQTEQRLLDDFKQKEAQLTQDYQELQAKAKQTEDDLNRQQDALKEINSQQLTKVEELKNREELLNRTISNISDEKAALTESVNSLSSQVEETQRQMEEKETLSKSAVEQLEKDLETISSRMELYKNKVVTLGGLLKQAISVTDDLPDTSG